MIFLILNFDFRFGQEVNVKLGSPSCKYLFTINDLYNGYIFLVYLLRLLRYHFLKIFNFDFRFGQEVKVKLGSPFCNLFFEN